MWFLAILLLKFCFIPKVPPDEPRIFDTHGKEISSMAGPFREGQEFFLSCQVSNGNPPPKVTWWRSDVEIPGTTQQSIVTGAIINNILIRAIPRDYYATKFTCRAQGSSLIDPVEKEVTVQLHCKCLTLYSCLIRFYIHLRTYIRSQWNQLELK